MEIKATRKVGIMIQAHRAQPSRQAVKKHRKIPFMISAYSFSNA
ncbi:hypothetical protein X765_07715 [Mesorhizobium sp. LSHC440B00]|nr:hypothetical protein X765_07715 [Mesorhizobium sp. LSHC440B00]ESX39984.1 hypothetical protein X763_00715 [Mesorhizobium sp. LSHC432A00]